MDRIIKWHQALGFGLMTVRMQKNAWFVVQGLETRAGAGTAIMREKNNCFLHLYIR